MEGRVLLECGECNVRREIVGEIPGEYTRSFAEAVRAEGWVPRPGAAPALICGACLVKEYAGHETLDDEEKVQGRKNPMEP
jgi:hypothetical protein